MGGAPAAMAVRTAWSTWPSSRISAGLRSSVQKAIRAAVKSSSSGARVATSLATLPSRISTASPFLSFSRASSSRVASCSVRTPTAA